MLRMFWLVALMALAADSLYAQHAARPALLLPTAPAATLPPQSEALTRFPSLNPLSPTPAFDNIEIERLHSSRALVAHNGGMPRWVKWGLVGAAGGALLFTALGQSRIDQEPNPVIQDAAFGAAVGFVLIGGSVALYDVLCDGDTWSRRSGLC
jgi:hypothetical protein